MENFEIRKCPSHSGADGSGKYELVKWLETRPREVFDWVTMKRKITNRFCYTVAFLDWDPKEPGWEFRSVGTRFLEDYKEGLSEYVLDWMEQHVPEEESNEYMERY